MLRFNYNIYSFIVLQLILLIICLLLKNKKVKRYLLIIYLFIFSIYMGGREFNIGTDTLNYVEEYLNGDGGYFSEQGFKYLGYILYELGFTPTMYLIVISLINTYVHYKGYLLNIKNREEIYIIIFFALFTATSLFGYVNILRQSIAGGFLLLFIGCERRKYYMRGLLYLILGFLFHKTIIFFLLLYVSKLEKIYLKFRLKGKYMVIVATLFFANIIPYFLKWHPKFNSYLIRESNNSFYIKLLLLLLFYIFISVKKISLKSEYILFYGLILVLLFSKFELLSSRLLYYISGYIPIVYLEVIKKIKKIKRVMYFFNIVYQVIILWYPSVVDMFKLK